VAAVYFEEQELARGEGPNKKAAETAAAAAALSKLAKAPKA
jgi:dsRNA-specific ribonuclease